MQNAQKVTKTKNEQKVTEKKNQEKTSQKIYSRKRLGFFGIILAK